MERRYTKGTECRIEGREDGTKTIVGYGAVFYRSDRPGTEYELARDMVERIAPSAFDSAMGRQDDVRALFNHDSNFVLGRTSAGTARMFTDKIGLRYEIDLPDTQAGRDIAVSIDRGDITGSSFAFVPASSGVEWTTEDGRDVRTITDLELLFDFGPVTYPAYDGTSSAIRSDQDALEALASHAKWRETCTSKKRNAVAKRARARLLDVEG